MVEVKRDPSYIYYPLWKADEISLNDHPRHKTNKRSESVSENIKGCLLTEETPLTEHRCMVKESFKENLKGKLVQ